jgi:hypothetical protein
MEFEPTIPAFEQAKTVHPSDRAATVTGSVRLYGAECLGTILKFSWWDWEKPQETSVSIVGVFAEIRTGYRPNRSQKRYHISQFAR